MIFTRMNVILKSMLIKCTYTVYYSIRSIIWWRQYSKKTCLHAQHLQEYSHLDVNQHILKKTETYTTSGRTIMTSNIMTSWCRQPGALFWFFSGKKILSHPREWALFFSLPCCLALFFISALHCSLMAAVALVAQQWKTRTQGNSKTAGINQCMRHKLWQRLTTNRSIYCY